MSLNWNWKDKVGTITFESNGKEFTENLYEGNAYLIEIYEYEEDGKEMYQLQGFFADKEHAERCLGIKKGYETYGNNMYDQDHYRWKIVRISKNYRHLKEFIGMLLKAFNNITIEVFDNEQDAI